MSRKLPNSGEHVASVLMNYGNFLSICRQDHNGAIDTLKEVSCNFVIIKNTYSRTGLV